MSNNSSNVERVLYNEAQYTIAFEKFEALWKTEMTQLMTKILDRLKLSSMFHATGEIKRAFKNYKDPKNLYMIGGGKAGIVFGIDQDPYKNVAFKVVPWMKDGTDSVKQETVLAHVAGKSDFGLPTCKHVHTLKVLGHIYNVILMQKMAIDLEEWLRGDPKNKVPHYKSYDGKYSSNRNYKSQMPDARLDAAKKVAKAIADMHKKGFYHGDLKSDNIGLVVNPRANLNNKTRYQWKIFDWGHTLVDYKKVPINQKSNIKINKILQNAEISKEKRKPSKFTRRQVRYSQSLANPELGKNEGKYTIGRKASVYENKDWQRYILCEFKGQAYKVKQFFEDQVKQSLGVNKLNKQQKNHAMKLYGEYMQRLKKNNPGALCYGLVNKNNNRFGNNELNNLLRKSNAKGGNTPYNFERRNRRVYNKAHRVMPGNRHSKSTSSNKKNAGGHHKPPRQHQRISTSASPRTAQAAAATTAPASTSTNSSGIRSSNNSSRNMQQPFPQQPFPQRSSSTNSQLSRASTTVNLGEQQLRSNNNLIKNTNIRAMNAFVKALKSGSGGNGNVSLSKIARVHRLWSDYQEIVGNGNAAKIKAMTVQNAKALRTKINRVSLNLNSSSNSFKTNVNRVKKNVNARIAAAASG